MRPPSVCQVKERNIRDSVRNCVSKISPFQSPEVVRRYTGISPKGAVKGAMPKLHNIFFRWNSCLSVAMVCKIVGIFGCCTAFPGKSTSILVFPYCSSIRRCALSDGILLSPHSSNGIRCCIPFPQVTRRFFQPFSASSQLAHVAAALLVALSSSDNSFDLSF